MSTTEQDTQLEVSDDLDAAPAVQLPDTAAGGRHRRTSDRKTRRAARKAKRLARKHIYGRHPFAAVVLVVVVGLTPVWVSFGGALLNQSYGTSLSARAAEWVRLHGGSSIVDWAENWWFSHHAPKVGGAPPKGAIPPPPAQTTPTTLKPGNVLPPHLPEPAALKPMAVPAIAGEGLWHPVGRLVDGIPAIYEAFLRPDAVHTSLVVGVAWMDTELLHAAMYSGSTIPGGGPYQMTAPIEPNAARTLIAAFNSGFLMNDSSGGYYTQGKWIYPPRNGAASFVIYRSGRATLGMWGRDVSMTPDVVDVRQNVDLLVDHSAPVPNLNANDTTVWGYTLGNQVYVWRSGIGVTANGALVYVAGPGLNITTLADLLVRAGAVRAMELDINPDWVGFFTYKPSTPTGLASPANGTSMLPDMIGTPSRYFSQWWTRDFFTMSAG